MRATRSFSLSDICAGFLLVALFFCVSCSRGLQSGSPFFSYLDRAYSSHYRSLDSVEHYLRLAEQVVPPERMPSACRAEMLNHYAFVSIARMEYGRAAALLDSIPHITDNQLELLVSYVQQMRLCQRQSRNREFYDYRVHAMRCLKRIDEERATLSGRALQRLVYAESELAIVQSTYYYYVGLEPRAAEALLSIKPDLLEQRDTAQFLNYLYNIGSGGIITRGTTAEIRQQEFDHLMRCLLSARQYGYPYFEANALEAIAEHMLVAEERQQLVASNLPAMNFLNPLSLPYDLLPISMSERALQLFSTYGDVYQTAGAWRSLASCYHACGDEQASLDKLNMALSDSAVFQAPDLVASIREQLSVTYAALNDKPSSDYNRNAYLDLQEQTRQDRQLEARAAQLDSSTTQLNILLWAVLAAILLLLFLLWLFYFLNRRQQPDSQLDDELEDHNERLALSTLHLEKSERFYIEQRAKVNLVNSIMPFIDRILHESSMLMRADGEPGANDDDKAFRLQYIGELSDKIIDYNEVLTHWIQLRKGDFSLRIETFALQPLLDILARNARSFQLQGISLKVEPSGLKVKADRTLTLFMLNTLADNARKFTPSGGEVSISATETADYVELSVADTGCGMTTDELERAFSRQTITDDHQRRSHGFGLLNCKGIIDKYRKLSRLFSVCTIAAESTPGEGSRFFFRLPKGIATVVVALFCLAGHAVAAPAVAAVHAEEPAASVNAPAVISDNLARASIYSDSAYFSNINGTYERTMLFADSCRYYLNRHYLALHPEGRNIMLSEGDSAALAAEIEWYRDSLPTNYAIILDIRNESAVAALSLHDWKRYAYNNKIYTQLFKEMSADNTLSDYCRRMQQSEGNKAIALSLLVLVLLAILPVYYFVYYRHRLHKRYQLEREAADQLLFIDDRLRQSESEIGRLHVRNAVLDNCLSSLKHETMYYPSRIHQLAVNGDVLSLAEVSAYYRDLYSLLSRQAMVQTEGYRLHLARLPHHILGDKVLIDYLFNLLRQGSKQEAAQPEVVAEEEQYVTLELRLHREGVTPTEASQLFSPSIANIPYLICRQIVRDHGEATNRRRCGIRAEAEHDELKIIIVLPRWK